MKKLLFSLTAMILISVAVNAQPYLQHRGLYVNGFIKFRDVNASGANLVVDQSRSILGVDLDQDGTYEKEAELIDYCKANHITYITLYDCGVPLAYINNNYRISSSDPGTHTFGWHLCRFINFCRANCIDKIGVAGGGNAFFDNADYFNNHTFPQTPIFQFPSYLVPSQLATSLNFVTQPIAPGDPQFEEAEITKAFLRAVFLPNLLAGCAHIDVINLESEYWNTDPGGGPGPSQKWQPWTVVLDYMNDIKYANNVTCGTCPPIYTEVYLGLLDNDNTAGIQNETIVGGFIDGNNSTHTSQKETDRILTHYYKNLNTTMPNDAGTVYKTFSTTNYYTKRFLTFGSLGNSASNVRPIYSSESIALGAPLNFAGPWLQSDVRNNIFSAERQFHDQWMLDAYHPSTPSLIARDNDVKPGASQWFTSSYMVQPLANRTLFTSTPVYSAGTSGNVDFTFQGPIEDQEEWNNTLSTITYEFWVTDNSGATQYYPSGAGHPAVDAAQYLTGATSLNTGSTTYNIALPIAVACSTTTNLDPPSRAHLIIHYPSSGCTLVFDQDVMVANGPSIISLSPSTHICDNQTIFLRANSCGTGTVYQWHRDYQSVDVIVGGNTQDLVATSSGEYYCILSGGAGNCYGTTNRINVTVDEVPVISSIGALCSGANITLTANVAGAGSYDYYWSDDNHSSTSQITVPYPASGTNIYSVNVTTQGTSCSSLKTITIPFKITMTSTGTACQGNTVTLSAPTTGTTGFITESLSNYLWSPGLQTSISIPVTASGTYSVTATGSTSQCQYSGSKSISFNQLPSANITTSGQLSYCQGAAINTLLNANTGANLTYQWQLNSINIGGATSLSYVATAAGSYTVVVTNTTTLCLNTSLPLVIIVNSLPVPTITGSNNVCINDVLVYSTQSGQTGYSWNVTGGTYAGGGSSITVTWNTVGAGNVSVNYTDANGCTATSPTNFSVTVNPLPTVTLSPFTSVCLDVPSFPLTGGSPSGGLYFINGNLSTVFDPSAIGVGNHTVLYTFTDANNCSNSATQNITVNPLPSPPTISGSNSICFGGSTQLNSSGSFTTYQWLMNGTNISGATNSTYSALYDGTPPSPDIYSIIVTNQFGCSASSSNTVSITSDPDCCGDPFTELTQNTLLSSGTLSGNFILKSNVTILSGITITLDNTVNISISAGNKILIANGGELILNGASLFPCNKMWKGIEVADQGSMVPTHLTILNGTTISGAEYAVNIIGNANVDIQNSTFDNNYLSVYFPVYAAGHAGAFTYENNTITQTIGTVLPSSYPTQTTALGTTKFDGHCINTCTKNLLKILPFATQIH